MQIHKKIGLLLIILSILFAILGIFISSKWNHDLGFFQNFLSLLRIQLFPDEYRSIYAPMDPEIAALKLKNPYTFIPGAYDREIIGSEPSTYYIDISTKYFTFVWIIIATIGLLIYLEIVSIPRKILSVLEKHLTK